jgi:hypothetical protein
MREMGVISLLTVTLVVLWSPTEAGGQQPRSERQALPTLTKAQDVHNLTSARAAQSYPVHLRAVVTYYDPYIDPQHPTVWGSDSSGGIYVELPSVPAVPL